MSSRFAKKILKTESARNPYFQAESSHLRDLTARWHDGRTLDVPKPFAQFLSGNACGWQKSSGLHAARQAAERQREFARAGSNRKADGTSSQLM